MEKNLLKISKKKFSKFFFQIRCVKTLMMNVLLESSNDVIMRIIQEELREHEKLQFERKKLATAPKIIGNSSALAALAAFGMEKLAKIRNSEKTIFLTRKFGFKSFFQVFN